MKYNIDCINTRTHTRAVRLWVVALTILGLAGAVHADQTLSLDGSSLLGSQATVTPTGLKIDFGNSVDWPKVEWKAATSSGWDWTTARTIVFTLTNHGTNPVKFGVRLDYASGDPSKYSPATSGSEIPAKSTVSFCLGLADKSQTPKAGMQGLPPSDNSLGQILPGRASIDKGHVTAYQVFLPQPKAPNSLTVNSIVLTERSVDPDLHNLVDGYGQYTRQDWRGKIHKNSDFQVQRAAESADWAHHPAPGGRDQWGGWAAGPRQRATGFFHTVLLHKRWWLVDPDGHLFLSVGITGVGPGSETKVSGRESMFTGLPSKGTRLAKYFQKLDGAYENSRYPGDHYDFNDANLTLKYGDSWNKSFNAATLKRLSSWGFNSFGNWSDEALARSARVPYESAIGESASFGFEHLMSGGPFGGSMPDPFDSRFVDAVNACVSAKAAQVKGDPSCIGYFCDNELPWGGGDGDDQHFGLCYSALKAGSDSPAKQAFIQSLKSRYSTIADLNAVWKTSFGSWDSLDAPYSAPTPLISAAQRQDFGDFLTAYTDRYYFVVAHAIKQFDPDHLYLGSRLAIFMPEVVKSCAKYADVISFNIYWWDPKRYQFAEKLGKPIIVGEFHFGALDRGMFSGGMVQVKDQKDRGAHYAWYVNTILSEPAFVGMHWFQYTDEPTTGRGDGEDYNIGFVSITDTPYTELIEAARQTNSDVYLIHSRTEGI